MDENEKKKKNNNRVLQAEHSSTPLVMYAAGGMSRESESFLEYTFLVITSQTLKIAFDFFKKPSADSNSSSKSILLLKLSSPYSKWTL